MNGVFRFSPQPLTTYGPADGLDEGMVTAVSATSDGNVWFIIGEKLSRFDGTHWAKVTAEQGVGESYLSCLMVETNGTLLVGEGNGVVAYEPSAASRGQPRFNRLAGIPERTR